MSIRVVKGELVRVVDGDTAHFLLDVGWGIILKPRIGKDPGPGTIRLVHEDGSMYDAPDKETPAEQKAAKAALTEMLTIGASYMIVSFGLDTMERRTLGAIKLADGKDAAAVMVSMGHVKRRQTGGEVR